MRNKAWLVSLSQIFIVPLSSALLVAAVPSQKIQKENHIKTVVQDVFREHGYVIEKSDVVLIEENGKLTIAMDVSDSIASTLSDQILERVVATELTLLNTTLEMNLFGAAEGVRNSEIRKNAIDPQWKDALSSVPKNFREEPEKLISSPAMMTPEGLWTGAQNSAIEKARSIILVHFLKIRNAGVMLNTILMESYWKDVFDQEKAPELFDAGRPLLSQALTAGVKPYREGRSLDASMFADLALGALGMQPVQGTGASIILFRP